jgi:predicted Zn-dependent protease
LEVAVRRGNIRLGVAAVTALVGALGAVSRPSKSEGSATPRAAAVSPEEEAALGRAAAPVAARLAGGAMPGLQARADLLVARLAAAPEARATPFSFVVQVVDDGRATAAALPGGALLVTRALLDADDTTASVAIAHAMGHVLARHAAEALAGRAEPTALTARLAAGTATLDDIGDEAWRAIGSAPLGADAELEADALGARLLAGAGIAPSAMARLAHAGVAPFAALHGPIGARDAAIRARRADAIARRVPGR